MKIRVPCDDDGMILLKCHFCGEHFKIMGSDYNDESTINIWCPYCGLSGKNYITDKIEENSMKLAMNEANRMIFESLKQIERQTKGNKFVKFKTTFKSKEEVINPIHDKINNLEIKEYKCCDVLVKIKPLTIECGSYCPICGGIDYE